MRSSVWRAKWRWLVSGSTQMEKNSAPRFPALALSRLMWPRVAGHKAGIQPVRTTVETCARLGLRALTLYAFSVENWKRPRAEVETLWRLLRLYLRAELPEMQRHDIRF